MSHTFSGYRIIAVIFLFLSFKSCKNEGDNYSDPGLNSSDMIIKEKISDDSLAYSMDDYDKIISEYAKKHNAITNFSEYDRTNIDEAIRRLRNNKIIIPLFKNQIYLLKQDASTDTVLTYFGKKSNSFVLSVSNGLEKIKKSDSEKNAVMLFKSDDITVAQKLYLMKKHTEFQHKEKKVTEFYISGDIKEVLFIESKNNDLKEIFKIE